MPKRTKREQAIWDQAFVAGAVAGAVHLQTVSDRGYAADVPHDKPDTIEDLATAMADGVLKVFKMKRRS